MPGPKHLLRNWEVREAMLPLIPGYRAGSGINLIQEASGGYTIELTARPGRPGIGSWTPRSEGGSRWSFTGMVQTENAFFMEMVVDVLPFGEKVVCLTTFAQRASATDAVVYLQPVTPLVMDWPIDPSWFEAVGFEAVQIIFPLVRFSNGVPTEQLHDRSVWLNVDATGKGNGSAF